MFLFGLGTIPLMIAVIYLGRFTKGNFRKNIQKAIPVFVFLLEFYLFKRFRFTLYIYFRTSFIFCGR
ncbi:urease accessory protein UreH domain-containing protein [Polaribacter sp.]|uniref:urease accessory protein UreH domain-containing protein n=1 Tax=Polaribacter sp. TaxID=1920175 RepID=UPI003F4B0242